MPVALVTGANGFVGSHLVRMLHEKGYTVRCLVRHTSELSSLAGLPFPIYLGDLRSPETLNEPCRDVDYIFHLAAEVSEVSEQNFLDANAIGTENLLIAAESSAKNTLKRFLFVSTQAAVGSGGDQTPYDETKIPAPTTWYGKSKLRAEEIVQKYTVRLPITVVRPSVVYGEREEDLMSMFPVIEKRIFPRVGFTRKYSVFVYVGDLVDAIIGASESENTVGQIYFCTHPEPLTAGTIIRTIGRSLNKKWGVMFSVPLFFMHVLGLPMEIVHHFTRARPMLTRDKARLFSERFWVASPAKAERDFGWKATHSLPEGMKKMADYYRKEKETVRDMRLEPRGILWLKFIIVAILTGAVFTTISFGGGLFSSASAWTIAVIVIVWYGAGMGALSLALRRRGAFIQFLAGWVITVAAELANRWVFGAWTFTPSWFEGLCRCGLLEATAISLTGGIFILIVNAFMRTFYKRRLRFG